jgi:hypothetical protein
MKTLSLLLIAPVLIRSGGARHRPTGGGRPVGLKATTDEGNPMFKQTIAIFTAVFCFVGLGLAGNAFAKPVSDAKRRACSDAYWACRQACPTSQVDQGLRKGCQSRCLVRYKKCGVQ